MFMDEAFLNKTFGKSDRWYGLIKKERWEKKKSAPCEKKATGIKCCKSYIRITPNEADCDSDGIGFFHMLSPSVRLLKSLQNWQKKENNLKKCFFFSCSFISYIWCDLQCAAVHWLTAAPITALVPWERQRLHSLSQQDCATAFSVIDGTRSELWLRLSHGNNVPGGRRKVNYRRKWGTRVKSQTRVQ